MYNLRPATAVNARHRREVGKLLDVAQCEAIQSLYQTCQGKGSTVLCDGDRVLLGDVPDCGIECRRSRATKGRERNMKPPILMDFPESFETERLLIRSPLPGDGPELHAAVRESIEELTPWMPWPKELRTIDDSEASARRARVAFLQRSELRMHLYLKGTDTLVGSSGLQGIDWEVPKFEVGYWCRTRFTGRGYVSEAVRGITAFAFDALGARRVEIRCDSLNHPSVRVSQRAGFRLEGELHNNEVGTDGSAKDTLIFALTPEHRSKPTS
jgi:RimJ/RimL family protein N-acetyltransferase